MYTMLVGRKIKISYPNTHVVRGLCVAVWVNKTGTLRILLENQPLIWINDNKKCPTIKLLD